MSPDQERPGPPSPVREADDELREFASEIADEAAIANAVASGAATAEEGACSLALLRAHRAATAARTTAREAPHAAENLACALERVSAFVARFVSFQNSHQSVTVTLWIAHVYAIAAALSAAYLRITSAVEESGKTTLLEVIELLLGALGINAVSISPAAVFRTRDKIGPVALLLDEIDNTLKDRKDDGARDLHWIGSWWP